MFINVKHYSELCDKTILNTIIDNHHICYCVDLDQYIEINKYKYKFTSIKILGNRLQIEFENVFLELIKTKKNKIIYNILQRTYSCGSQQIGIMKKKYRKNYKKISEDEIELDNIYKLVKM